MTRRAVVTVFATLLASRVAAQGAPTQQPKRGGALRRTVHMAG